MPRGKRVPPLAHPPRPLAHARGDIVVVVALALVTRIITALQLTALPITRSPHYDSLEYLGWARRVAAGDFTWPVFPPHGPGYPYFLGAVLALFGGSLVAAAMVQSIVGALTCWLVARTTKALFGARAGLAAGLLLAVYVPLIWIDVSFVAEGLLMFAMALALWSAATQRHPALTGFILGVATLIRPTTLILLPLLLLFGARTWRIRGVMAAVAIAVIVPVTIANWRASHAFIPVQAFGGMNFYIGNSPLRDGLPSARPGADWERIEPEAARHGATSLAAEDRYFVRKTRQEIAQHPAAYAALLARKLVWTVQNEEVRDTHSFYFFRRFAPLLWLAPFAILFGLAVAGAFAADWRARGTRLIAGYVVLTAITSAALVVGARYRMPMVIGLAPFAGLAIDRIRERKIIVIAVVAAALTLVWRHAPSHNVAEEWALTSRSLAGEGNAAEAERAARTAIELDPRSALAYDALGSALAASGRVPEATEALRRAVALNPDFGTAHLRLAQTSGDPAEYERALACDPRDARALRQLADTELQRGNVRRAAELTARLAALQPNPDTWLTLARLQGAERDPVAGLRTAHRAMAMRELSAEEWLLVATLATDAHQFAEAQQAIDRAQAGGAPPVAIVFNTALLRFREGKLDEAAKFADELLAQRPDFVEARQLRAAIEEAKAH